MGKVEFLNKLQIRLVELETGNIQNNKILTEQMIKFAKNGRSQILRKIFQNNDDLITVFLQTNKTITRLDLDKFINDTNILGKIYYDKNQIF